jgi:hypothetical protein
MGRMAFRKKQRADVGCWALALPRPGVLHVRKRGPALRYEEIRKIAQGLLAQQLDQTLSEIVFDFSNVREIVAPWTPVVAQLIDFARQSHAACRITALHGRPAAIVALLLGDGVCRELLHIEDLPAPSLN